MKQIKTCSSLGHFWLNFKFSFQLSDPGTENCARYIQEMASQNWKDYEDLTIEQPQGHLLSYPVDVSVSVHENVPIVTLKARTKKGKFLGTRAKIIGSGSKSIPNKLTT